MSCITTPPIRCAIYTRKSTEENLHLEFNSLDAQRESGENYIASQAGEGWVCLSERYDDGGYTGGNMKRPALGRLIKDIEAGRIDCVIVYKVDRLSRSLSDFGKLIEVFNDNDVAFVSVTQQFNTATSGGRLMLNMLLSFAQFEREMISDRTRDKIALAKKKGKWTGGKPILGYNIHSTTGGSGLVINDDEADQIRCIFDMYLEHESLLAVVKILNKRGWTTKRWMTKAGRVMGELTFNKSSLHHLLTNVTYIGKIRHKEVVYEGEHEDIVEVEVWEQTHSLLRRNGRSGGREVRNKYGALLRGLLFCSSCGHAMTHTYTKKKHVLYRYYTCTRAQSRGRHTCPSKSLPAAEIERFIVDQIRGMGSNAELCTATIARVRGDTENEIKKLSTEHSRLVKDVNRANKELACSKEPDYLVELHTQIEAATNRLAEIDSEIDRLKQAIPSSDEIEKVLIEFDAVWDELTPREQIRVIKLLIQRVEYDGAAGAIDITFHPASKWVVEDGILQKPEAAA